MKILHSSPTEYQLFGVQIHNVLQRDYCIFDLEATGPNPTEDQIIQFGACISDNDTNPAISQFEAFVKPARHIPPKIEKLTGISNDDVKDASCFSEVYVRFLEFCKGRVLVTQAGYEFDLPLLEAECKRHSIEGLELQVIDTKALFTYLHPEINEIISTNFLLQYYSIPSNDLKRHTALADSILIKRIFECLLDECRQRAIVHLNIDCITVKKVKLS